jgi:hypothetical protein
MTLASIAKLVSKINKHLRKMFLFLDNTFSKVEEESVFIPIPDVVTELKKSSTVIKQIPANGQNLQYGVVCHIF